MSILLSLPSLVWCEIMDLMDLHNLKKLRCVCKQTKTMVEKPKYLQKFKVPLRYLECLEIFLNSIVPWNNFLIDWKDNVLPHSFAQFGKSMEHLEIRQLFSTDFAISLSNLTPRIQTLIIGNVFFNPHNIQSPIWAKNFIALKKLQINKIMNFPDAPKTLFEIILDNCTHHLTHLTIPGLWQSNWPPKTTESHFTILIFQPVLNYLKRIEESQAQTNLVIDFNFKEQVEVLLNPEILLSILQISSRLGVKLQLYHVPIHGLQMNGSSSLTFPQHQMLQKSVLSVVDIVDKGLMSILPRVETNRNRYIPIDTQIHVRIKVNTPEEDFNGFQLQSPIHSLEIFHLWFPSTRDPYRELFQTQRPTVQKLEVSGFMEKDENQVMNFPQHISFSFPNLKDLCVRCCTCFRSEDFNGLVHGLPALEKLKIWMSYLKDDALLGDDYASPCIFKLTRLKHLDLLGCNGLTDVSFTTAFRYMKLHTFKWSYDPDFPDESTQVTFQNGISSLNSIDGGLKDSVQCLVFKTPGDCTREEVDEFVNKFKSLTYFNMEQLTPSRVLCNSDENESAGNGSY